MDIAQIADADLVARCRDGEEDAWAQLVERFSRYVYAIAVQVYRLSAHDAEDVFQEVFSRTYERLDELRDDAAIKPWIAQLARRLSIDRLRVKSHEGPGRWMPEPASSDEAVDHLDEALDVHDALSAMPGDCREVVDRFFVRDQSYKTIAAALDLPQGTVASRISRCLAKLKVELEGR